MQPVRTPTTLQQRLESSPVGQGLISAVVSVIVLVGIVWNLPDSAIEDAFTPPLTPVASAAGLEQHWQMYAPDPIQRLEFVDVHVTMADGTERVWAMRENHPFVGQFAWYHWQKLKEQVIRQRDIRAGIAHWVVRKLTTPSERPLRVQMIFRAQDNPAPGKSGPMAATQEVLYDETLTGAT
jgi:hypothetical protein